MAKINIKFNNKSYSIDSTLLADALASLEGRLVAMMDEPTEPELGFPITWNSMEVMGNATLPVGEEGVVKVSDYIPSVDEMANTTITVTDAETTRIYKYETTIDAGVYYFIGYGWSAGNKSDSMEICIFPTTFEAEGNVAEAGVYATNFGSMGYNADCVLDIAPEERLEGDGAEYYTLAPTALSFRSTAPLNELQEVQINGVAVDPANYTLEEGSTIVTFPIDYLKTLGAGNYEVDVVSDSKTVKGGFTVAAPELNEHGFYYNQPYTGYVDYYDTDMTLYLQKDGTINLYIHKMNMTETGTYVISDNIIEITTPIFGTTTWNGSANGIEVSNIETGAILRTGNKNFIADADFIYTYNEDLGGYVLTKVFDKYKSSYGVIRTGINDIDTVAIGEGAFNRCIYLTSIKIPNSVISIDQLAFNNCYELKKIEIPENVSFIHHIAFDGWLENILVSPNNTTYHSDGNCLIETASKTLIVGCIDSIVPTDGSVTAIGNSAFSNTNLTNIAIPDSITSIGTDAFFGCPYLTSVATGSGVTSIGFEAFYSCSSLTSVTIGNSVTSIGRGAFDGCSSLTSITYNGTVEQWSAITLGTNWNLNVPATHVHCTDGDVAL